jgi:uncharacterized lipoprotein YddW (UPF0748 family)
MRISFLLLAAAALLAQSSPVIDDWRYRDDASARAAWQPMRGSAPVSVATVDGQKALRLPCNFSSMDAERASWDHKVALDLARAQGVQFQFYAKNTAPVSHFTIYFQSGDGWYSGTFYPQSAGWNTITIDKAATRSEGQPAGWGSIRTIRISAWRGRNEDTELYLGAFRTTGALGVDASVAILRSDSPDKSVQSYAQNVAENLRALGIGYATLSEADAAAEQLRAAKVVILPYNPDMPDHAADELVKYARAGGKLLVFYSLPAKLGPVVKIASGKNVRAESPAQCAASRFANGALAGAPPLVEQRSWNINAAKPVAGGSRVLAEWLDEKGDPTNYPAVVASDNCIMMTHVLLRDDPINKGRMLMAMIGWLAPEVWKQSAAGGIVSIGRIGGFRDFDGAARGLARSSKGDKRVRASIESVRRLRASALKLAAEKNYPEALEKAAAASQEMAKTFAMAQQPLRGEFRAFWCHRASGVEGMDWDEAIKRLADSGFTAILPNMLWAGVAFYASKVLPVAPEVAQDGDQIAKCLAACRKYGVQIHVWKVDWNLGHTVPDEFVARMRQERRLQASSKGKEEPWLCPSHPENQKLEIAAMVEVARNYDVDGIHFDYIRYPDSDHCFCDGCRERFAKAVGRPVEHWPRDVLESGPLRQQWLDWRRSNITTVVKAVSEQARAIRPKIKISAAVFRNWAVDRDGVGQDWKLWCEKGYLDFVCPMDYSNSDPQFENWVASQKEWAGKVPVYPGIGEASSSSQLPMDRVIGQIQIARRHQTNGFVIFNYGESEARDLLPILGLGITAKR